MTDVSALHCRVCTNAYDTIAATLGSEKEDRRPTTLHCCGVTVCIGCAEGGRAKKVGELRKNRKYIPCMFCMEPFHSERLKFIPSRDYMKFLAYNNVDVADEAVSRDAIATYDSARDDWKEKKARRDRYEEKLERARDEVDRKIAEVVQLEWKLEEKRLELQDRMQNRQEARIRAAGSDRAGCRSDG